MLIYGFRPPAVIDVNIHHDELRRTQNILRDMQDMLHIARANIKIAQDRACFYVDHERQHLVFNTGQNVFLCVPHNSKTLSTGKCAKLAPRFCGPFTILKRIGSSAYRLNLPNGVEIHPVFHVSRLEELLGFDDNTVTIETLVTSQELDSKPHVPERVLDVKMKNLRSKIIQEYKIKWMDKSIQDATWQREQTLITNFPNFSLQECNVLKRGSMLRHKHKSHGTVVFYSRG